MQPEVRPLRSEDLDRAWQLRVAAFDSRPGERDDWMASVDLPTTVGVFVGDELAAMCRVHTLGQFFGGRSVPMGGLASVAVAPEHRGRGHASLAVVAALARMKEQGQVVSTLHPATTRLYRGLGWEIGGRWGSWAVPSRSLAALPAGDAERVRRGSLDDLPGVQACYARAAAAHDGLLDRPDGWWRRELVARWDRRFVFVADGDDGEIEAYLVYGHTSSGGFGFRIHVHDALAERGDALTALWRVVGSSYAQVDEVTTHVDPQGSLLLLLPEQDMRPRALSHWMVRLVDAGGAIGARGFPPGLAARIDLDVNDRQCPWNAGRWRFTVAEGRGHLERGGTGAIRLGIGGLSSLYSGWSSARTLHRAGLLSGGTRADLATLDAAFAGPTPWMPDFF